MTAWPWIHLLEKLLKRKLAIAGLQSVALIYANSKQAAWDVEYRVVKQAKGQTLVSIINYLPKSQTVKLNVGGHAVDLLDNGRVVDIKAIVLAPMVPKLLVFN